MIAKQDLKTTILFIPHRSVYVYTFLALVTHSEVATFQLNDTSMGASAEESGLEKHL